MMMIVRMSGIINSKLETMKWNNATNKPKLHDNDWYKESKPVICQIEYTTTDWFTDVKTKHNGYCLCTWVEMKNKKEWRAVTDHLSASTMPSADFNIIEGDDFKVIKWANFVEPK